MACSDAQKKNKPALIQSDIFSILCTMACVVLFMLNVSNSFAGYFMLLFAICCCCSCLSSAMDLNQVMAC